MKNRPKAIPARARSMDRLVRDHRAMRGTVRSLRQYLTDPRPEPGGRGYHTWASGLTELLVQLHSRFYLQFREEERSESLQELMDRRPHVARRLEEMRDDHERILTELRRLVGSAMVYSEGKLPDQFRLRRRARTILDRFDEHQIEELDLVQKLHYLDIGVGD